jgi:hypothetical protein
VKEEEVEIRERAAQHLTGSCGQISPCICHPGTSSEEMDAVLNGGVTAAAGRRIRHAQSMPACLEGQNIVKHAKHDVNS